MGPIDKFYKVFQRCEGFKQVNLGVGVLKGTDSAIENDEEVLYHQEGDKLEILIDKLFLYRVFKQCHDDFNDFLALELDENDIINMDGNNDFIINLYKSTLGLLITTPGNDTAVYIHSLLFRKIYQDNIALPDVSSASAYEVRFVETLLTSMISRINKSSILWHLYKTILTITNPSFPQLSSYISTHSFPHVLLVSARKHPRNYYSWNFIRWAVHLLHYMSHDVDLEQIQTALRNYCYSNWDDSSAWSVYLELLAPLKNALEHTVFEFERNPNTVKIDTILKNTHSSLKSVILAHFDFLKHTKVCSQTPWNFLKELLETFQSLDPINHSSTCNTIWNELKHQSQTPVLFVNGKFSNQKQDNSLSMLLSDYETLAISRNVARVTTLHERFYQY